MPSGSAKIKNNPVYYCCQQVRYWMASETCRAWIRSMPSRSGIAHETRNILSYARPDKLMRVPFDGPLRSHDQAHAPTVDKRSRVQRVDEVPEKASLAVEESLHLGCPAPISALETAVTQAKMASRHYSLFWCFSRRVIGCKHQVREKHRLGRIIYSLEIEWAMP